MRTRSFITATLVILWVSGCASPLDRAEVRRRLEKFASAQPPGAGDDWVLPPEQLAHRFMYDALEIRSMTDVGVGMTGTFKATLFFHADRMEVDVKWKPVLRGGADSWNNSPRKELASYAIQQLFLDPEDYVVPTSVLRCVPLEIYRRLDPDATATIEGTHSVLGVICVWLKNVTSPEEIYDERRFLEDSNYAYHMANLNLLTYLINHKDSDTTNILVATDSKNRRVFAVDNGIAFGSWLYNYFVSHLNKIRVPALRKESINRLRRVTRSDLAKLGVLCQLQADENGLLRPVNPQVNLRPSKGVRVEPGMIQLGLTESEIDEVEERIQEVLEEVDAGDIPLF